MLFLEERGVFSFILFASISVLFLTILTICVKVKQMKKIKKIEAELVAYFAVACVCVFVLLLYFFNIII